jgi:hypothetical protein
MMATTFPCTAESCHGGTLYLAVCRGGSDHAGHHCGGAVCGDAPAGECSECEGTGEILCEGCRDRPATVREEFALPPTGRIVTDYYCAECASEAA